MSGETEEQISGWTVDTLHSHLLRLWSESDRRYEQRFHAQENAVESALAAAEKASDKADAATDKRFDGVNEFRGQLADQARTFIPRAEYEAIHTTLVDRVTNLETAAAKIAGRSTGVSDFAGYVVGVFGLLIGIAGVIVAVTR